jgi:hypothetical protein
MNGRAGSRLPAEWKPQAGVMLTWPHEVTDWADRLHRVYPVFVALGRAVAERGPLLSVCHTTTHVDEVPGRLLARYRKDDPSADTGASNGQGPDRRKGIPSVICLLDAFSKSQKRETFWFILRAPTQWVSRHGQAIRARAAQQTCRATGQTRRDVNMRFVLVLLVALGLTIAWQTGTIAAGPAAASPCPADDGGCRPELPG